MGLEIENPQQFLGEAKIAVAAYQKVSESLKSQREQEKQLSAALDKARKEMQEKIQKFDEAMEDDFNTADAVAAVFEIVKIANSAVKEGASADDAKYYLDCILERTSILGLEFKEEGGLLDEEIEAMIEERQAARKAKDSKRADEIRNELLEKGIVLEDTREGVRWKKA